MKTFKMWLESKRPVSFFVDKVSGGRALAGIAFSEVPPPDLKAALRNAMDKQGMEDQGKILKFYQPNDHINDVVFDVAKQIIHRHGYQRFDSVWHSQEDADELFGHDAS